MKKKMYLLGHPLAHSKSPVMHNAVFEHLGLDLSYLPMDCKEQDAAQAFIEAKNYLGLNITTPHKPLAVSCADELADSAKLAGGANVLINKEGSLLAYNMDGKGCVANLERKGFEFKGARVLICGTGPTALAIMHAVACADAHVIYLTGRSASKTEEVLQGYKKRRDLSSSCSTASDFLSKPRQKEEDKGQNGDRDECAYAFNCDLIPLSYDDCNFEESLLAVDLLINATPVGMKPQDRLPFNTSLLHERQTVFDVVYGHGETHLMSEAKKKGCKAYDGSGMLVAQAVATDKVLFEAAGLSPSATEDEIFDIMAQAAGFEC